MGLFYNAPELTQGDINQSNTSLVHVCIISVYPCLSAQHCATLWSHKKTHYALLYCMRIK